MSEEKKPVAAEPVQIDSYGLDENEQKHITRLVTSEQSIRLRLLQAKEQVDAAQAALKQAQRAVKAQKQQVMYQAVQLASAVATLAANRGEERFQDFMLSEDGRSITRKTPQQVASGQ